MRLINVSTLETREFPEGDTPEYAILSHTWGDQEITLQGWQTISQFPELLRARPTTEDDTYVALQRRKVDELKRRAGYKKIMGLCHMTSSHELQWAWIDTCCIDKTSSSELSEAINSIFRWYEQAVMCFVYLVDVLFNDSTSAEDEEAAVKSSR